MPKHLEAQRERSRKWRAAHYKEMHIPINDLVSVCEETQQIIEDSVEKIPEAGCWLWKKSHDRDGYGHITYHSNGYRAHRFAYAAYIGPIKKGSLICHTCDVPECCNPNHLYQGTNADNSRDAVIRDRYMKGENVHQAKLTEDEVMEIRKVYKEGQHTQKDLAQKYDCCEASVSNIINRITWKHL